MKEFLDNLYKQCASSNGDGIDQLFRVLPPLFSEKKFGVVDSILQEMDVSRVDTSTIYATVNLTSRYIHQLAQYRPFYQRGREEFARRHESSEHIEDLFGKFENGWEDDLYDPDAPPRKPYGKDFDDKLNDKIAWAKEQGDKDLTDMLTFYQAERLRRDERDRQFRELRDTLGDEVLRARTIKSLRDIADMLDKTTSSWPGIYYANLPEDPLLKKTFIDSIEVTISYPWPG